MGYASLNSCILIDHFNSVTDATKDFDLTQHPFIEIPYSY
jgi:hypothetical protein